MTRPPSPEITDALNRSGGLSDALNASEQAAEAFTAHWTPEQRADAAALALHLGRPRLAWRWAADPLLRAAAQLRLGEAKGALGAMESLPDSARKAVLRARAFTFLGDTEAASQQDEARRQAILEGDSPALIACAVLRGEARLHDPHAALRTLAEGLKVTEMQGTTPDPHLLAVLAHAQRPLGPGKAALTAQRALEFSAPRSPARVLALLALGQGAQAQAEAQAGELHPAWWAALPGH